MMPTGAAPIWRDGWPAGEPGAVALAETAHPARAADAQSRRAPGSPGRVVLAQYDGRRIGVLLASVLGLFAALAPIPHWSHGSIYAFVFQSPWGLGWLFLMLLVLPYAALALALTGLNALRAGMASIYVQGAEIVFNATIPLRMPLAEVVAVDRAPRNRRLLLVSTRNGRQWGLGAILFQGFGQETVEAIRAAMRRAATDLG